MIGVTTPPATLPCVVGWLVMATPDPAPVLPRFVEMAAMFMIGDGLLGLVQPERHVALWRRRALGAELTARPFEGRPMRRRIYGAAQIAAGVALAARQRER
jgi:hypothetical protein